MFPSSKAVESSSDDSEERRLFYVAVTRAKDELVIASPSMRVMRDGSTFFCKPSRFVKEIPRSLLKEHYGFSRY
jgi:DNA helicase-2/ATP-dependent DNA helicase PcrA